MQNLILTSVISIFSIFLSCKNNTKQSITTAPADQSTIQIKGSDTMVNLAQAWAEEYKTITPQVNVEVSGGGSGVGIAALTRGAIDIANASRNVKKSEIELVKKNTGKDLVEFIVGYDALVLYVHKDNPITEITLEQLEQIYSENGNITRWSQLGVTIPGKGKDKIVLISRQSSSGTYEFFREHVLKKKDFKLGTLDMNGSKEVVELIGHTKTAIGYSGMGYATDHVKMLKIIEKPDKEAIPPTIESTQNKTYPLARSLLIYTLGQPEGKIKDYMDYIFSEAGQKQVLENGYVPIPKTNIPGPEL
ncbi:MAG: phosphate ABC transporter substrate-binding protein [Fibrobacter sp.]|nr:phosphate ABC transporter substrate-binding protein [Fibrobacter sp.]